MRRLVGAANSEARRVPPDWRWVRLGDLSSSNDAFADGPFGSNLKTEHYVPSGARVSRLQNIGIGRFLPAEDAFIGPEHFETLRRHHTQPGDVVVAALGDGARPAGRACVVPDGLGPALVKADCFRIRLSRDVILPEYLVAFLNSPGALAQAADRMRGATRPRPNLRMLQDTLVPLAPLSQQRGVVDLLSDQLAAVERARAAAEARLEAAAALTHAHLRRAFCGITPLAVDDTRAAPPRGWRWVNLRLVARLESGHTPSRYHPEYWGGDILWLALPDIRAIDGKVAMETAEHTNELGIANSAARVLPPGTVVLSRTASVGFVTIMGRPMATSQDFVNWVCGADLDHRFLAYLLRASRGYIRSLASGAVHKTVLHAYRRGILGVCPVCH